MKPNNVEKLKEEIVRPDWERRLAPLLSFRGVRPYRLRSLWNAAHAMFLEESPTSSAGLLILNRNETGHLCGLHGAVAKENLKSIFGRLRGCKPLTDSVSKVFTEYVEWIHPGPCTYCVAEKHAPRSREKKLDLNYPFVTPKQEARGLTIEHQLLVDIHRLIPRSINPEIRDDLCQDLLVAVLSGETTVANIPDVLPAYRKKAAKMLPHWGQVSWEATQDDRRSFADYIDAGHHHA